MATEPANSYPRIPEKYWWAVRDIFRRTLNSPITPTTLASLFDMEKQSAQSNIIRPLVKFGIIDEKGQATDRAIDWRDDEHYPGVCKEILREVYPPELLELFPGPEPDREAVERWLAKAGKLGPAAARGSAATYALLWQGDPSKAESGSKKFDPKAQNATATRANKQARQQPKAADHPPNAAVAEATTTPASIAPSPSLHIDIQVHIAPEASLEQIDQIFASMAKHLCK